MDNSKVTVIVFPGSGEDAARKMNTLRTFYQTVCAVFTFGVYHEGIVRMF
ncbi:MAG: hypothetical protein LBL26_07885 [Peptococcaceae bacterium]|jgi:hypothetical protein|nr:hypothetical protein [Peptococcaceae bacterium]